MFLELIEDVLFQTSHFIRHIIYCLIFKVLLPYLSIGKALLFYHFQSYLSIPFLWFFLTLSVCRLSTAFLSYHFFPTLSIPFSPFYPLHKLGSFFLSFLYLYSKFSMTRHIWIQIPVQSTLYLPLEKHLDGQSKTPKSASFHDFVPSGKSAASTAMDYFLLFMIIRMSP